MSATSKRRRRIDQISSPRDVRLRLAELLATVSLATDLAHGVPAESALRDAVLAVRVARLAGFSDDEVSDAYYLALLYHVGCTAAVAQQSRLGDDVEVRRWLSDVDFADKPEVMRVSVSRLGPQWGVADWARATGVFADFDRTVTEVLASFAEVAVRLAQRLGARAPVCDALAYAYARWDGKVFVDVASGEAQSRIARLVHLVHVAQSYQQLGGSRMADDVVRRRRGGEFDPQLAGVWLENSGDLLLGADSVWDEALAAEPEPHHVVARLHMDGVCAALADFTDLKSPYTLRHSAELAALVQRAAAEAGLTGDDVATLHRAAMVHDLGNVSVPGNVWIKRAPLNRAEWDRVKLHAYHSQRIMAVTPLLREPADIAGQHHERVDGSGYHRGVPAAAIPFTSRLLMAAEVYQSMVEERSWRPAMSAGDAARELRRSEGLDRRAVDAVLAAVGAAKPGRSGRSWPSGLTDREVDVLRHLARGMSNKQIAKALFVSDATVHTHVINVYGKIGVNTRAGATLFAIENDLIQVDMRNQPNG
jgi:DNA-binding CsgD family transcriptional regulator